MGRHGALRRPSDEQPWVTRCGLGCGREIDVADKGKVAAGRTRGGDEQTKALLEHTHDPSRVLALSDGVFAIISTLLVLDIHLPKLTTGQSLTAALREIRPLLVAFLISFLLAGMYSVG